MVVERKQDERWPAVEETKAALRHLAGAGRGSIVDRAEAAVGDLEAAVAFVESGGLAELEAAIAATDDPARAARGARALAAYRRYRAAAAGRAVGPQGDGRGDWQSQSIDDDSPSEPHIHQGQWECGERPGEEDRADARHFHRGRGSDLRRDGEPTAR